MIISRASKQDLPAIRFLMQQYGNKMIVTEDHLNKRDIALQARIEGELVGFAWGGLMAKNTIMYIDKVAVDPKHNKQGIVKFLYKELFKQALQLGVKQGFGMIRQDQYHDRACINALKMAFGADSLPYTHVFGEAGHISKELESIGE